MNDPTITEVLLAFALVVALIFNAGCASNPYQTTHSTPYIQFAHEGKKQIPRTPREVYFDNQRRMIDNMISSRMCIA